MSLIKNILLVVGLLSAIVIPIALVTYLHKKKLINHKGFLIGIIIYVLIRMIIYPIFYAIANLIVTNYQILLIKLLLDIIFFAILAIGIKRFIYKRFVKYNCISMANGEAIIEIVLVFLPNLLNKNILNYIINYGNPYNYFSALYNTEQITDYISNFNNIPVSYYLFLLLMIYALISVNNYIAHNINNKKSYLVAIVFYTIYIFISVLSYPVASLFLILLIIFLEGKKNESISSAFNSRMQSTY